MLFAAYYGQIFLRSYQLSFFLKDMEVQSCLYAQDPVKGIIQTFLCDSSVSIAFHHIAEVFFSVVEEQIHVAACSDRLRNLLFSRNGSAKHTDHMGSISNYQTVKS